MPYSEANLIRDVRRIVQDNPWETTTTTTGTGTTIAVPDGTKWAVGDVGEWSFSGAVGGEQFLVQAVSGNNLTVVRGYNDTTVETHASGDRIVKNPDFTVAAIRDSVRGAVESLYPSAWAEVTSTVVPSATTVWYDSGLAGYDPSNVLDLRLGHQVAAPGGSDIGVFGPRSATRAPKVKPVRVARGLPAAFVPSGIAVRFPAGFFHPTNPVTLRWRKKITADVSGGVYVDIEPGLLAEIVVYGTVARLLSTKEAQRVVEEASIGEVEAGTYVSTANWFEMKMRELLAQYHVELMRRIPPTDSATYRF